MSPLDKLAAEYHRITEAYDRTVCTGPIIRGAIQPRGNDEFALVNQHALMVHRQILRRAMDLGYTRSQFREAVGRAS